MAGNVFARLGSLASSYLQGPVKHLPGKVSQLPLGRLWSCPQFGDSRWRLVSAPHAIRSTVPHLLLIIFICRLHAKITQALSTVAGIALTTLCCSQPLLWNTQVGSSMRMFTLNRGPCQGQVCLKQNHRLSMPSVFLLHAAHAHTHE